MEVDWDRVRVVLGRTGRVRCEPGWSLSPQWGRQLEDFDLWFVWAGRGRMILGDGEVALRPGICIWARPGCRYEATQEPDDRLGVSFIHFDLVDADAPSRRVTAPIPPEVNDVRDVAMVDAMMRRIVELSRHDPLHDAAQRHIATTTAAALTTSLLMDLDYQSSHRTQLSGTQLRHHRLALELASRIDEQPGDAAAVWQLAKQAGYSPGHFTRVFKSVMGQSPQSYTVNARINRARQLLRESNLSISEIADVLGYEDLFFFSRQFKQKAGQSPRDYRRAAPEANPRK